MALPHLRIQKIGRHNFLEQIVILFPEFPPLQINSLGSIRNVD